MFRRFLFSPVTIPFVLGAVALNYFDQEEWQFLATYVAASAGLAFVAFAFREIVRLIDDREVLQRVVTEEVIDAYERHSLAQRIGIDQTKSR